MNLLQPVNFFGQCFNVIDGQKFTTAIQLLRESLFDQGATLLVSDNVITWNRNYSFLREKFFQDILNSNSSTAIEKSIIWRIYVLTYFAELASRAEGDFIELGCHTGHTAEQITKVVDFKKLDKQYYLYDLFEWKEGDEHTHLPGHDNPKMYDDVVKKFAGSPFVKITRGSVPETLEKVFPEKIAFAHIDMNHPDPEAGALEKVLPRLSKGGIVVFDDYGWWGYSAQKMALDPIIAKHGFKILELPTAQAILINL